MIFLIMISTPSIDQTSELIELNKIISEHDLEVEDWAVTIKEPLSVEQAHNKLDMFDDDYTIDLLEDKKTLKYTIKEEQVDGIKVMFIITIPKESQYQAELISKVEGTNLDHTTLKEYKRQFQFIVDKYFTERSKVFTCLTTTNDDIINSDVFLEEMLRGLKLQHVSTQVEHINESLHQEIIYGYTTLWDNKILLEDNPLNTQVVIQSDGNQKQKIIIGTPILITEY